MRNDNNSPNANATRAIHWAVRFEGNRPAIPFTLFHPAYSLAKRATNENHPAQALEVYEVRENGASTYFDANGNVVRVRGVA